MSIESLLLKHMNDYNMDREKKADHGLPTYINTYNPTEDASDPIRKVSVSCFYIVFPFEINLTVI